MQMQSIEHPHLRHVSRRHHEGGSLLSSTSAPVSTIYDSTTNTTPTHTTSTTTHHHHDNNTSSFLNTKQQREAQLRHALQHTNPTPAEVSAVASAAYVQALMELIDQHSTDVQQISDKIDTLQAQRETYHADLTRDARQRDAAIQELRNERSNLTLQVQEAREQSTRLLHETTVLHSQQAELKEQLARLVELCHARGKRLRAFYHHLKHGSGGGSRSRANQQPHNEEGNTAESEEEAEETDANRAAVKNTVRSLDALAAATALPCKVGGLSSSAALPASLSIHQASQSRAARPLTTGGADALMSDLDDDAELAAILHLPYKVYVSHPAPPGSSPHSKDTTTAGALTVTANTTGTAQLLALQEEVHMLRQQLEEQRATYEQERGARTREDNAQHRRAQEQLATYAATVEQLEALHEESLRELVLYRHGTEKQLRDLRGQVEWLRVALHNASELAEKDRRQQHNEVYATEQRMAKQYYPKVQSLHSELAEYRRSSAAQARDYAAALAKKDEQIAALQQRLKAEAAQRRRVEERYKLEMDGVHSELDLMRQSLRQMERRVYYRNVRDDAAEEAEATLEQYYH
jgi:DNA repair exonuclease SbcCD ATPase subunit